ncbi:hypothetical protein NUW54_g3026 [Trametes sanguinea]|uniref:Uncharacterized protein n=1 Tax=Trametes sanguinea TaxID=158606 RepID=A0ACC1Q1W9_9APHY|nr:hypothetical protein NUW54_g3026 [Trametes sanguinea]
MSLRDAVSGLDGLPASVVSTDKFFLRCLIVGCTLSTILYGITLQQAYLYYARYPRDKLPLKLFLPYSRLPRFSILDTVATIFMPEKMSGLVWSLTAENCLCIITSVMVQCYFGQRLWILSRHNKLFTGLLFALAFVELGMVSGMWLTANMALNPGFSAFATQRPRVLTLVYSGCSSVCDVFITAGLCYYLHTNKSGVKRSNSLIDKLMIYAVQRGIITLICQAYDFLTVSCAMPKREPAIYASFETLIAPTSFLFIPVALMQMKVYTNSLLATLNVRESLKSSDATIVELQSHSLVFAPPAHVQAPHDPSAVRVRAIPHSQIKVLWAQLFGSGWLELLSRMRSEDNGLNPQYGALGESKTEGRRPREREYMHEGKKRGAAEWKGNRLEYGIVSYGAGCPTSASGLVLQQVCDANGEEAESTTVRSSGSEVKVGGLGDETEVSAASYGLAAS